MLKKDGFHPKSAMRPILDKPIYQLSNSAF